MERNRRRWLARSLGALVLATGAAVALGWLTRGYDPWPTRAGDGLVVMKFSGAVGLALAGLVSLIVATRHRHRHRWQGVVLSWAVLSLLALCLSLLVEAATGARVSLDAAFGVRDVPAAAFTVRPGAPSLGAVAALIAVALFGLVDILSDENAVYVRRAAAVFVFLIGGTAVAGHTFGVPGLFFYVPETSSALSPKSAVCLLMLGEALWLGAGTGCTPRGCRGYGRGHGRGWTSIEGESTAPRALEDLAAKLTHEAQQGARDEAHAPRQVQQVRNYGPGLG